MQYIRLQGLAEKHTVLIMLSRSFNDGNSSKLVVFLQKDPSRRRQVVRFPVLTSLFVHPSVFAMIEDLGDVNSQIERGLPDNKVQALQMLSVR